MLKTLHKLRFVAAIAVTPLSCLAGENVAAADPSRYNIVWDSPSKDANGSMPIGNGDIGANVWVEPNGDLIFYVSKSDAWGDNARLLKVGKVRVTCTPALFEPGDKFSQKLDLENGNIVISSTRKDLKLNLNVWVDANNPVIHVDHNSSSPVSMTAKIELWRTEQQEYKAATTSDIHEDRSKKNKLRRKVIIEPDTIVKGLKLPQIAWYHHNIKSDGFDMTNKLQGLSEHFKTDLILHRTFGALITGSDAQRIDDTTLTTKPATSGHLAVTLLTTHPDAPEQWLSKVQTLAMEVEKTPLAERKASHQMWWKDYWSRSWIHLTQGSAEDKETTKRIIPESKHTIKIASDQNGKNGFGGAVDRVSIFKKAFTEQQVQQLAKDTRKPLDKSAAPLGSWAKPNKGDALKDISQNDLSGPVTLEAWIQPGNGSGRILDMISIGGVDGFLLDVHPAKGLRFICGKITISKANCLTAEKWHHVAAVIDAKKQDVSLYLDGKKIASHTVSNGGDEATLVSRSYALQRYMDACAGRGAHPIKFNGSIFTAPHQGDPDFRRWGPGYWWQNTRLPYLSMCTSGDYELMKPLFKMYAEDVFEVNKLRTKKYLGVGGTFYPECVYFWGSTFTMTYGWTPFEERKDKLQQSPWHKWEWACGPELVFMMLDYYDHTHDEVFLKEKILPVAKGVVQFFHEHYKTNADGQLVMHPSMACETWWECTNPMPELAGLHAITSRLIALESGLITEADRKFYTAFSKRLAPLPTRDIEGSKALAPATKFAKKMNSENPELYAVFPFRLCSFEKDNAKLGELALQHRWNRGAAGWRQDDLFMTHLGLTDLARKNLISRCKNYHKGSRFPAFWGPNMDWTPDQCHGGVLMRTVQTMLLQADPYSRKIYLKPALPKEWNCTFKLHAPYKTIIEGSIVNGKVTDLKVTPKSRRKDIIIRK